MADTKKSVIAEWGFKILSMLVIPLMVWGIKLEVNNALQNERIETLQKEVLEAKEMHQIINQNQITLGRLEEKLNGVHGTLDTIKDLLRQ